jgi:hypothetical protein
MMISNSPQGSHAYACYSRTSESSTGALGLMISPPLDQLSTQYRPFYFLRRSLVTLDEFGGAISRLNALRSWSDRMEQHESEEQRSIWMIPNYLFICLQSAGRPSTRYSSRMPGAPMSNRSEAQKHNAATHRFLTDVGALHV